MDHYAEPFCTQGWESVVHNDRAGESIGSRSILIIGSIGYSIGLWVMSGVWEILSVGSTGCARWAWVYYGTLFWLKTLCIASEPQRGVVQFRGRDSATRKKNTYMRDEIAGLSIFRKQEDLAGTAGRQERCRQALCMCNLGNGKTTEHRTASGC